MNIGLKFITMERSFDFFSPDFELNENNILDFGNNVDASSFMNIFFQTFAKNVINEDDKQTIQLEPYIQYTKEKQNKFLEFISNYQTYVPKLKALEKYFSYIKDNEIFCVLPSYFSIDTKTLLSIKEDLYRLNNKEMPNIKDFLNPMIDNYNLYHFMGDEDRKIGHKNKEERICRWCNNTIHSKHAVTFNEKAHAISESLGNKTLILYDECDECNHRFANTIEKDITNYFKLFNTIWGVKGKNGIPKIKFNDIEIENNELKKQIEIKASKITFKDGKPVSIAFNADKLTQQNIYKALCKFALSLVDESTFQQFDWTVNWINGKENVPKVPIVKELFTYKFFPEYPVMQIYIRKNDNENIPKLFGVFYHTNNVYLFIVPKNHTELNNYLDKNKFNEFMSTLSYNECKEWKDIDFSDNIEKKVQIVLNFTQRIQ